MKMFSLEHYRTVEAIATCLLPSDDTPGAQDTPVVPMVMGTLKSQPPDQVERFRFALEHVNMIARDAFGDALADLPVPSQEALVRQIAAQPELALFWHSLRSLIMLCFYSIPKVYESIGLPGPSIDRGGLHPSTSEMTEPSTQEHGMTA